MTRPISEIDKPKLTRAEAGRLGALARHRKFSEELAIINKKIMAIRLKNNPNSYREMSAKAGRKSKGGGR